MEINTFLLFAFASLVLNITPGADMLYVATRSASQGVKAGIVSALGIMAGCVVHLVAAVAGLSAIIANSATAFSIVKYLGAAYLIYLGLKTFFSTQNKFDLKTVPGKISLSRVFWQGVATNVLNPKVALFFLAFLPQFVDINSGEVKWQILLLGTWFNISGTIVNILVALVFGRMGNWFAKRQWFINWQNKITGLVLLGLGIKVALSSRK